MTLASAALRDVASVRKARGVENSGRLPDAVTLEFGDVRLEPLAHEHIRGLHAALADTEVWRHLGHHRPEDESATQAIVDKALEQQADGLRRPFATLVGGVVAGTTSFWDSDILQRGSRNRLDISGQAVVAHARQLDPEIPHVAPRVRRMRF